MERRARTEERGSVAKGEAKAKKRWIASTVLCCGNPRVQLAALFRAALRALNATLVTAVA